MWQRSYRLHFNCNHKFTYFVFECFSPPKFEAGHTGVVSTLTKVGTYSFTSGGDNTRTVGTSVTTFTGSNGVPTTSTLYTVETPKSAPGHTATTSTLTKVGTYVIPCSVMLY